MGITEADAARMEASVSSLSENVARFDRTVERMIDKMETGNLKRDEAIGALGHDIKALQALAHYNKELPQTVKDIKEWMITIKAKNALMRAMPGILSGFIGAIAAAGSAFFYFK